MTSPSQQILERINEIQLQLDQINQVYEVELNKAFHSLGLDKYKDTINRLENQINILRADHRLLVRQEEEIRRRQVGVYSKAEKKKIRKNVYDQVKDAVKYLGEPSKTNLQFNLTLDFYTALKKANLKDSLATHKKCVDLEYKIMEDLLENPLETLVKYQFEGLLEKGIYLNKDTGESELVRILSGAIRDMQTKRKNYLKMCMTADAKVGYWGLSK